MFNFLFDGSIGDYLAPVQTPVQQLHLAIQHHRNSEVVQLIETGTVQQHQFGSIIASGYADIHLACRYNNAFVVELLHSKGIPLNYPDRNKNTPLHYAAKHGHLELCKYLIERGASAGARNLQGETPYDVAVNHIIRQYLLPLQFVQERDGAQQTDVFMNTQIQYSTQYFLPPQHQQQSAIENAPAYMYSPPPIGPLNVHSTQMTTDHQNLNPPRHAHLPVNHNFSTLTGPQIVTSHSQDSLDKNSPRSQEGQTNLVPNNTSLNQDDTQIHQYEGNNSNILATAATHGSSYVHSTPDGKRIIKADGFGSSASDPVLKKKYGHVQEVVAIGPPPTTPAYNSNTINGTGAPLGSVYSKYVPYNPNVAISNTSSFVVVQQPNNIPPFSVPLPTYQQPPLPQSIQQNYIPPTPYSGTIMEQQQQSLQGTQSVGNVSVFNPATDKVISATSTSSAIL